MSDIDTPIYTQRDVDLLKRTLVRKQKGPVEFARVPEFKVVKPLDGIPIEFRCSECNEPVTEEMESCPECGETFEE